MIKEFERFQISQVGILIRDNKCLIGEFNMHDGRVDCWGLPGGRLDKGEYSEAAFRREIKEELGLDDFEIKGVVDYDIWYVDYPSEVMPVCGVASLISNEMDEIRISEEHHQFKWVTKAELSNYNFLWPTAKRMIEKAFEYSELIKAKED